MARFKVPESTDPDIVIQNKELSKLSEGQEIDYWKKYFENFDSIISDVKKVSSSDPVSSKNDSKKDNI